jgi:hypothetical protein
VSVAGLDDDTTAHLVLEGSHSQFGSRNSLRRAVCALRWIIPPIVILVLTWTPLQLLPQAEGDPSWQAAVEMAVHQGLPFGQHIIWTYGPLGFLTWPAFWETHIGEIGVLYTLVLRLAVAVVAYYSVRRTFNPWLAFVVSLAVLSVAGGQMDEIALGMMCGAWALDADLDERRATVVAAAFGAFAAMQCMNKISIGVFLAAMAVVLALALPGSRRNHCAATAAGFFVSLVLFWVLVGQPPDALPHYIFSSLLISGAYSAAMGYEQTGLGWEPFAALFGVAVGIWSALRLTDKRPLRRRYGLILLWCVFSFGVFKEGFVRHDSIHAGWFFSALIIGILGFRWKGLDRALILVAIVSLSVISVVNQGQKLVTIPPTSGQRGFRVKASIKSFFKDVSDAVDPADRTAIQLAGRAVVRRAEPLSTSTLALLRGHTVDEYPYNPEQAWAYGLDWDPIPVILAYQGNTTRLDADDAAFLNSDAAPERIVTFGTASVDGRVGAFDQSATTRVMLCHYRTLQTTPGYLVLARSANRCTSTVRAVKTVHADWGKPVTVPALPKGHWMLYVRIYGTAAGGLAKLVQTAYKAPLRYIQLDHGTPARLVTGTATDGLLLKISPGYDYKQPFNISVNATSIDAVRGSKPQVSSPQLTYIFVAQRLK